MRSFISALFLYFFSAPSLLESKFYRNCFPSKIPCHNNRVHSKRKNVRWYSHDDYTTACDLLCKANLDSSLDSFDIDNSWKKWHNTFLDIMKKRIPGGGTGPAGPVLAGPLFTPKN